MHRLLSFFFACSLLAGGAVSAPAQSTLIVTDPALNLALLAFETGFRQYVDANPQLTSGATQPIALSGSKGQLSYALSFQGRYSVAYDSLRFDPTSPISAKSFVVTVAASSVSLTGTSHVTIQKADKTYDLDCPDTSFSIGSVTVTAQITVNADNTISVANQNVAVAPGSVSVSAPCLQSGAVSGGPSAKMLKKTIALIRRDAGTQSSSILAAAIAAATAGSTALGTTAASPCAAAVREDANAVIADFAAVSGSVDGPGAQVALLRLRADLLLILPSLSAPDRALVGKLVVDFEHATSANSLAGTAIDASEQATLALDLSNLLIASGATAEQAATIAADVQALASAISGASTVQLQADIEKLVNDARACRQ